MEKESQSRRQRWRKRTWKEIDGERENEIQRKRYRDEKNKALRDGKKKSKHGERQMEIESENNIDGENWFGEKKLP